MQVIQKIKQFLLHRSLISGSSDPGSGNRLRCSRSTYIKNQRNIRIIGSVSLILLFALTAFTLRPVSVSTDFAEATANPSTTTLTVSTESSTALLDITPSSTTGTFSSSDNSGTSGTSLAFNVSTNNITGYNLGISHASSTTPAPLVDENLPSGSTIDDSNSLSSLPVGTSITDSDFNTSTYVGYYGYKPNMLNSQSNSNYIPAPTTSSTTLNKTTRANTTSDNYTIALGANIDYTKSAGTYTNTFILTAVANNVAYTINYKDNTNDSSVSNLPTTESASTATASRFTLSSTVPTRTGYTFNKWCDGTVTHNATGNDTCSGTTYGAGGTYSFANPSSTSTNVANLYAMWNVKTYSLAITFAGTGVSSVKVCKTAGSCSGTNLMGTVSTSGNSVSGLTYGVAYYLYPTYSTGHTLSSWAKTDTATNSVLSSASSSNPTYKIGDGNGAVKITGKARTYSLTITFAGSGVSSVQVRTGSGTSGTLKGTVSTSGGSVSGLTYNTKYYLYPTFSSGYTLDSWSKTSTYGTLSSTTAANPTFTMGAGTGKVTITGKTDKIYMQDMTASQCTTTAQTVYDKRDEQAYLVQKLADGKCWLLDNLRLGYAGFASGVTELNSTNTNTTNSIATSTFTGWKATSGFTVYNSPKINVASANTATTKYGSGSGKIGVYYNYCAATMNSYCYASGSGTGNASQDVCPKGWRMPTGGSSGEYQALYTAYSSNDTNFRNALSTPLSGYFYDSSATSQGGYGYFWSSTYYDGYIMYYLHVNSSDVDPQDTSGRVPGYSVRCVLKEPIESATYMQDITSEMVANTSEGATATLRDIRDNQDYTVAKINDNLWMTRNLAIGCNGSGSNYGSSMSSKSLTSADSNVANTSSNPWSTPTLSLDKNDNTSGCTTSSTSGCNDYVNPRMKCNSTYGAWYNYAAVSAGTITGSSNDTDATKDICPAGWRLPTNSEQSGITGYSSAFRPVTGGFYRSGSINNTGYGVWWSATAYDTTYRYNLGWDGSSLGTGNTGRGIGLYVRCIRS